jgi:poly(A) polymerase
MMNLAHKLTEPVFRTIGGLGGELNLPVFVIGGYVRDLILGRPSVDIDIVVHGSGIDFATVLSEKLGREGKVSVYKNFGTAALCYRGLDIEFVGARKESYRSDSRKPIVEDGTLEDDQNRRDFTINAMAVSLNNEDFGTLVDPFGGLSDLKNRIIRTPLEPGITFSDDPLRMMRAIRFASQLDFVVDPDCLDAISANHERIQIVSAERISDELNKILASERPADGIVMLSHTGLLGQFLPEVERLHGVEVVEKKGHKDNFFHTMQVLQKVAELSDNLWLRWVALLHDVGKPATKKFIEGSGWTFHGHDFKGSKMAATIFRNLHLPVNEKLKYVQKLIALHLRPAFLTEEGVSDSAVRRLLFDAGDDIDDLMILAEADITSKNMKKVEQLLSNFEELRNKLREVEEQDKLRNWQPPVSGAVIMDTFGLPPSREVGLIKTAIREAILDGIIPNEYEAAYKYMCEEAGKMGLKKNSKKLDF